MNATRENLLDLLELQKIDSAIDRLNHRKRSLPEQQELDRVQERIAALEHDIAAQQAVVDDAAMRQRKLDADIDMIAQKIARDEQRLFSGDVSNPKELAALQAEVESLKRRRASLEDTDLEVMEEREVAEAGLRPLLDESVKLRERVAELTVSITAALSEIETELASAAEERNVWAPKIDQELLSFYDDLRASKGGVAAAPLVGDMCEGCHMKLPAQEVQRVRASTGLVRCDECGRILVVT